KGLRTQNKRLKSRQDRFEANVKAQLSKPDPRLKSPRGPGANYTPLGDRQAQELALPGVRAEGKRLKGLIASRHSATAADGIEQARELLDPVSFARLNVGASDTE